jgi:hypothetical protein
VIGRKHLPSVTKIPQGNCKLGLERKAQGFPLPYRPLARLAQNEERGRAGREARSRGELGEMTRHIRRKSEFVRLTNERNFPHLVELALPPEGFRDVLLQIDAFHRERRIPVSRGRSRHEVKRIYIRFCFPDTATADAFRNRFGGECLTHAATSSAPAVKRIEHNRPKRRVRAIQYGPGPR